MQDFFDVDTSNYLFSQLLFIKALSFVYLITFWSLFHQVLGLYGSKGIAPIQETLLALKSRMASKAYRLFPTLFWWDASDRSLRLLSGIGMGVSLMALLGVLPPLMLFLSWMLYLSFVSVGVVFLSFQWDSLLLEVGFLAIFFSIQSPPPILLLWALWLLLFRFIFASGAVKLLSGCREWWDLSAMEYHYETQPIPNRIAYYAHHQPKLLLKLSTLMTFFFELLVPFLIFGNQWMRLCAFILLVLFQIILMITGNFAFFNLLTIALCLPLLDNTSLEWLFGLSPLNLSSQVNYSPFLEVFLNGVGLIFIILNLLHLINMFLPLRWFRRLMQWIEPYYFLNSYGLFANMTTRRDEIIVEGSLDGKEWKTYEFKWKPGDLHTPPKQMAPYHPRLDWQMWFAALSPYQANPWLINFLARLLEGSKDVEVLLKNNPFPDHPPKFIRTLLYEYHFSDLATKRATGQWWVRRFKRLYAPILSLPDQKSSSLDIVDVED